MKKKVVVKTAREEELKNRAQLRERAMLEQKRENSGQWCSGVGISSSKLIELLDKIEELEKELEAIAEDEAGADL